MIELDRSEAIRYMGYHGTQPDEAVQASLTRCGEALQQNPSRSTACFRCSILTRKRSKSQMYKFTAKIWHVICRVAARSV